MVHFYFAMTGRQAQKKLAFGMCKQAGTESKAACFPNVF